MNITEKQFDEWVTDLQSIHKSLDSWYSFAVNFIGERPKLLEAKQGIEKLKTLAEFLVQLKPQIFKGVPDYAKDKSGRWSD